MGDVTRLLSNGRTGEAAVRYKNGDWVREARLTGRLYHLPRATAIFGSGLRVLRMTDQVYRFPLHVDCSTESKRNESEIAPSTETGPGHCN